MHLRCCFIVVSIKRGRFDSLNTHAARVREGTSGSAGEFIPRAQGQLIQLNLLDITQPGLVEFAAELAQFPRPVATPALLPQRLQHSHPTERSSARARTAGQRNAGRKDWAHGRPVRLLPRDLAISRTSTCATRCANRAVSGIAQLLPRQGVRPARGARGAAYPWYLRVSRPYLPTNLDS